MSVCHHDFEPSTHECYDVCLKCGSFRSAVAPPPEEVYTADYWTPERGHSTLEEQVWNCEEYLNEQGVSKNDFLLNRVLLPQTQRGDVLEVGCSPGALLVRLRQFGFKRVYGVDLCSSLTDEAWKAVATLYFETFPGPIVRGLDAGSFDLVIASDVFEHSHRPHPFLLECARLLDKGGQLLMMMPVVGLDAAEMPERMFHPVEHVWLHSADNLTAMLGSVGFHSMTYDRWLPGHETVSAIKGDSPDNKLRAA
jgi:SAM-dependent methyltransferase